MGVTTSLPSGATIGSERKTHAPSPEGMARPFREFVARGQRLPGLEPFELDRACPNSRNANLSTAISGQWPKPDSQPFSGGPFLQFPDVCENSEHPRPFLVPISRFHAQVPK